MWHQVTTQSSTCKVALYPVPCMEKFRAMPRGGHVRSLVSRDFILPAGTGTLPQNEFGNHNMIKQAKLKKTVDKCNTQTLHGNGKRCGPGVEKVKEKTWQECLRRIVAGGGLDWQWKKVQKKWADLSSAAKKYNKLTMAKSFSGKHIKKTFLCSVPSAWLGGIKKIFFKDCQVICLRWMCPLKHTCVCIFSLSTDLPSKHPPLKIFPFPHHLYQKKKKDPTFIC